MSNIFSPAFETVLKIIYFILLYPALKTFAAPYIYINIGRIIKPPMTPNINSNENPTLTNAFLSSVVLSLVLSSATANVIIDGTNNRNNITKYDITDINPVFVTDFAN